MKKVKFMLTAIAVLAVVGGALAFKAKSFGSTIYCDIPTSTFCNHAKVGWTIEGADNAAHCVLVSQDAACDAVFTKQKA